VIGVLQTEFRWTSKRDGAATCAIHEDKRSNSLALAQSMADDLLRLILASELGFLLVVVAVVLVAEVR